MTISLIARAGMRRVRPQAGRPERSSCAV